MLDILAVVGSQHWPPGSEERVKEIIRRRLEERRPDLVISGGAAGVDTWAIEVAQELGIPNDYKNYLPENPRWQPRGYKARNIKIGKACTRLLLVRNAKSATYGSGWTAKYTESLAKPVEPIVLDT